MASVLHLGNIHFAADEESNAQVTTENQLKYLTRVSGLRSRRGQSRAGEGEFALTVPTPSLGSCWAWKAPHCGKP